MYPLLLTIHSLVRWAVLVSLLYALLRAYRGWLTQAAFSKPDDTVRHTTATIAHVQLLIGLGLYFSSPLTNYFWDATKTAMGQREIRFFGMEHPLMMFVAIVLISIGSALAKRKTKPAAKFKTIAIWFTVGLVVLLLSIPWPFSPWVSRPYGRVG
jgi:FtsH-binding integral membrane protein